MFFKKVVSSAIIISMVMMDVASCGNTPPKRMLSDSKDSPHAIPQRVPRPIAHREGGDLPRPDGSGVSGITPLLNDPPIAPLHKAHKRPSGHSPVPPKSDPSQKPPDQSSKSITPSPPDGQTVRENASTSSGSPRSDEGQGSAPPTPRSGSEGSPEKDEGQGVQVTAESAEFSAWAAGSIDDLRKAQRALVAGDIPVRFLLVEEDDDIPPLPVGIDFHQHGAPVRPGEPQGLMEGEIISGQSLRHRPSDEGEFVDVEDSDREFSNDKTGDGLPWSVVRPDVSLRLVGDPAYDDFMDEALGGAFSSEGKSPVPVHPKGKVGEKPGVEICARPTVREALGKAGMRGFDPALTRPYYGATGTTSALRRGVDPSQLLMEVDEEDLPGEGGYQNPKARSSQIQDQLKEQESPKGSILGNLVRGGINLLGKLVPEKLKFWKREKKNPVSLKQFPSDLIAAHPLRLTGKEAEVAAFLRPLLHKKNRASPALEQQRFLLINDGDEETEPLLGSTFKDLEADVLEETHKSPRLQEQLEIERVAPLLEAWLYPFVTENAALESSLIHELESLIEKHSPFLPKDFKTNVDQLIEGMPVLSNLTMRDWLEHYGFIEARKGGKEDIVSEKEQLCEFLREVVLIEIRSQLLPLGLPPSGLKRSFWPKSPVLIFQGEMPTLLGFLNLSPQGFGKEGSPSDVDSRNALLGAPEVLDLQKTPHVPFLPAGIQDLGLFLSQSEVHPAIFLASAKFFEELEALSPLAKAQLIRIAQEDVEGKITKMHILGFLIGTGVAGWLSEGMVWVFDAGVGYLGLNYLIFGEEPWMTVYNDIGIAIPYFVIPTVILDAWPRNVHAWKNFLISLREGEFSKGQIAASAFISFWPSILEPFYLILLALEIIEMGEQQGFSPDYPESYYIKSMLAWTWPLLMDSWAANGSFVGEILDDLQEDKVPFIKRFLTRHCFSQTFYAPLPSEEAQLRHDFSKKLDKLSHFLYSSASKDVIKTMYGTIKGAREEIQEQFPHLTGEELQNAQGFFTLRYLLSMSDQIQKGQKHLKSWYDKAVDGIIGFNLIMGSPARLLVFELIVKSITNLVPGNRGWLRKGINWGLAAGISLVQTVFEGYGMKAFFKNFLVQEDPQGHTIYKGARIPAKVYAGAVALIYTSLLAIATLQTCNDRNLDPHWMIGSISFLFAEFATQAAVQWGWSTQQGISIFARIHNLFTRKCSQKPPRTQFERDELVELTKTLKGRVPYLRLDALQMMQRTLEENKGLTENKGI
ncbi:MAG: hypothetical protein K2P93_01440 [Alphaproteobacteria bacterium]|nr:hypothetical protein [Alphaproteobacteria bacterium]